MKYCADTWFLLKAYSKEQNASNIIENVKYGKDSLIIPIITIAEFYKRLSRFIPITKIDEFISALEISRKIEFIPEDKNIAREAARISLSHAVPLIDSIIASTARLTECHAILTADEHLVKLAKKIHLKIISW